MIQPQVGHYYRREYHTKGRDTMIMFKVIQAGANWMKVNVLYSTSRGATDYYDNLHCDFSSAKTIEIDESELIAKAL